MARCLSALALAVFVAVPLYAQEASDDAPDPPARIPSTAQHEVRSSVMPRDYRVFIALPESYTATDTTRYPVLYVLDGNDAFPIAVGAYRYLRVAEEVRDLIIVGVGYPVEFFRETAVMRWADYTPSSDVTADSAYAPAIAEYLPNVQSVYLRSGGAAKFLRTLTADIIPLVERTYRTTTDRGLWGHSLGGGFALHALFAAPGTFSRYAAHSPTVWWDDRIVLTLENTYAQSHSDLPARVFVSVGSEEGETMVTGADTVAKVLRSREYANLVVTHEVFENETHMSSVPAALSRALRLLYPPNGSEEKR